jgi:hypothetical protein
MQNDLVLLVKDLLNSTYDTDEKVDELGRIVMEQLLKTAEEDPERFQNLVGIAENYEYENLASILPPQPARVLPSIAKKIQLRITARSGDENDNDDEVQSSGKIAEEVFASGRFSLMEKVGIWLLFACCWYYSGNSLSSLCTASFSRLAVGPAIKQLNKRLWGLVDRTKFPGIIHSLVPVFDPTQKAVTIDVGDADKNTTIMEGIIRNNTFIQTLETDHAVKFLRMGDVNKTSIGEISFSFNSPDLNEGLMLKNAGGMVGAVFEVDIEQTDLKSYDGFFKTFVPGQDTEDSWFEWGIRPIADTLGVGRTTSTTSSGLLSGATRDFFYATWQQVPLVLLLEFISEGDDSEFNISPVRILFQVLRGQLILGFFQFALSIYQTGLLVGSFGTAPLLILVVLGVIVWLATIKIASVTRASRPQKVLTRDEVSRGSPVEGDGTLTGTLTQFARRNLVRSWNPLPALGFPSSGSDNTLDFIRGIILSFRPTIKSPGDWKFLKGVLEWAEQKRRAGTMRRLSGELGIPFDATNFAQRNPAQQKEYEEWMQSRRRRGKSPASASTQVRRLLSHTRGNTEAAAQLLAKMYPLL